MRLFCTCCLVIVYSLLSLGYRLSPNRHRFHHYEKHSPLQHLKAIPSASLLSRELALEADINALRASKIKSILKQNNINTMGEFEKQGLADILIAHEKKHLNDAQITSVPLINITSFTSTDKSYIGVELRKAEQSDNDPMFFVVDTGATINLIRPEVAAKLNAKTRALPGLTSALGGQGSIATSIASIDDICLGNRRFSTSSPCEFSVLSNSNMLPMEASGLLGLSFLNSIVNIDEVTELDFKTYNLRVGPRASILTPFSLSKLRGVTTYQLPNGLLVAKCEVDEGGAVAMIDLGSSYTIANTLAVEQVFKQKYNELPLSSQLLAGIDGRPIQMRCITMNNFRLGDYRLDAPLNIVAGDIPGLATVGLGTQPALILGMDVLAKGGKMVLDLRKQEMFLSENI